jgi:hypothetical protein
MLMAHKIIRRALFGKGPLYLSSPVFNRLQSASKGFLSLHTYLESAGSGDYEEMEVPIEGGALIFTFDEAPECCISFMKGRQEKGFLQRDNLVLSDHTLPQATLPLIEGRTTGELIDLPASMLDFCLVRIKGAHNLPGNKIGLDLDLPRIRLDRTSANQIVRSIEMQIEEI